jgi:hypothetical protein
VKQQHTSTATSILTTKSTCHSLSAQRLSDRTVFRSRKQVVGLRPLACRDFGSESRLSCGCLSFKHFTGIALQLLFNNWIQWNNSTLQRQLRYWQPNLLPVACAHSDFPNALYFVELFNVKYLQRLSLDPYILFSILFSNNRVLCFSRSVSLPNLSLPFAQAKTVLNLSRRRDFFMSAVVNHLKTKGNLLYKRN